jgi:hypothetical protein|tara:strand:+ start:6180 stop:6365 length:186 start_codon:yes stop_codon:yes gene_type:complete
MNNILSKNNIIIIIFCILGIYLYITLPLNSDLEDKLFFIFGYVVFVIVLGYLLTKPKKNKK